MKIKSNIIRIPTDEDVKYLALLSSVLRHSDPEAELYINVKEKILSFYVYPATQSFKEDIIKNVLALHRRLRLKTEFSKSSERQKLIYFSVNLEN